MRIRTGSVILLTHVVSLPIIFVGSPLIQLKNTTPSPFYHYTRVVIDYAY